MTPYQNKEKCCGCGACRDACPVEAIRMARDPEGFWYPQTDAVRCIQCGRCQAVCPIEKTETAERGLYFGAKAREDTVRYGSSSGGVFPVLAEYVFRRRGAVFGAGWGEHMEAVHQEARSREELEGLKGTKYVQSRLEGVYRRIEALLREDEWVLFSGTPCQAHALRLFLGKPYPKLLTADLVCYGAPSPGVWEDYVRLLERRHGGALTAFSFRDKRNRDSGHTRAYVCGGKEFAGDLRFDPYCGLYFANCIIRPACHACPYCTTDRGSDFTLGDFWGIEKIQVDDGMGNSLVMLHTDKSLEVWTEIREELDWFPCEREDLLQPRLVSPTPATGGRRLFMALRRVLPGEALFILAEKARLLAGLRRRMKGR
ncbi:MAG: Coenzyme F420 hydrogenase/dehydrogenase, beta subunit C-terminal domain [Oscillospiraceae bacterium]|nr:Coenzyme F420 hydrogenase/dehydrogenase, beta subunit C-terminal domain [Oscillospiraceae bacterium]